jgi:uncharacterized protein
MYRRLIIDELLTWKGSSGRKPLLLRGARQVGKTTVVDMFSKNFKQYIYLNLEREEDAEAFRSFTTFENLIQAIFFIKSKNVNEHDTLIFIDEIQEVPSAINLLRYFYEDYPQFHVIAAGSLLENILGENTKIPVGRIEYRILRPVSFAEFLEAVGEEAALKQYNAMPVPDFAHQKLLDLFHLYTLIGGMPEIVQHYASNRNLTALLPIYESLIVAYLNDIEKYAKNSSMVQIMRHVVNSIWGEAGSRIKFQSFGQSNYGSREIGEAIRTIQKAMILQLIYPVTSTKLPMLPDLKKSPRLQVFDTGLLNRFAGIQKQIVNTSDLNNVYQGRITEHIVGQEILASKFNVLHDLHFWVRERKGSLAEVDLVYPYDGRLFPIEIKSGASGHLRSLHLYMDESPHEIAFRLYSGKVSKDEVVTPSGKKFNLINLPYFLAAKIEDYIREEIG